MTLIELKNEIHSLVDRISDEEELKMLHEALSENSSGGSLFDTVTKEEQQELLEAIEESKDPNNRIPHDPVMKEAKEWLSR